MKELFKNKFRIKSTRLPDWNYSSEGIYFVTICVKNRECILGDVVNGKIKLLNIGEIVKKCWYEIPQHFNDIVLDEFVIMPNHLHGIIEIINCRDAINRVSTTPKNNNKQHGGITKHHYQQSFDGLKGDLHMK